MTSLSLIVIAFIARGFHVQGLNDDLLSAVKHDDARAAALALQAGAEPDTRDKGAPANTGFAFGQFLIDRVLRNRRNGEPVLIVAAKRGSVAAKTVDVILRYRADPNVVDAEGTSGTMYAVGDVNMLRTFVDHRANIDHQNAMGKTALEFAAEYDSPDIPACYRLLLERHAKLDVPDANGNTALSEAAYSGKLEMVRFLLERGADSNHINADGMTVLDRLAGRNSTDNAIVKLLQDHGAKYGAKYLRWSDLNRR